MYIMICQACEDGDKYFKSLLDLSTFGDSVCPCGRDDNGLRKLFCCNGVCGECKDFELPECDGDEGVPAHDVKYKWLRPVKIGNRNESEWAYVTRPYPEFIALLKSYYHHTYKLHNWVYKWQDRQRRQCRSRLQRGSVILEYDYAAKATQFQQESMPCSAARRTSQFVCFAHFNPTLDEAGNNLSDTTEVFTFHSNCLQQDTHSIARCLLHVLENLIHRRHLDITRGLVHLWADGCMAQNKGRKALRQYSELSVLLTLRILANFPATAHFGGPWDTEGGRQTRAIKNYIQNERDISKKECVLDASDNVRILRQILNKAGTPDPPVVTQMMWRPVLRSTTVESSIVTSHSAPKKPKRQARGRTQAEMEDDDTDFRYAIARRHIWHIEPCNCDDECVCPSDGRLTYKRDEKYDCTPVEGNLTTYCYYFQKKALQVQTRQYSCYCRWCSRAQFNKCVNLDKVRHRPDKPIRPLQPHYQEWISEGWRTTVQIAKSAPDAAVTRVIDRSVDAAAEYVSKLPMNAIVAIRTLDDGKDSFWLASKQSEIIIAPKDEPTTGVTKGEKIFSIVWYDRLSDYKYEMLNDLIHVSVSSVVVTKSRIMWNRTTTNRFYLGEHTHTLLMDMVRQMGQL